MEEFRTIVPIEASSFQLDYASPICLMGSCFSTNMSERLKNSGFDVALNPSGILFHPFPIADTLLRAIKNQEYSFADLREHEGQYLSLSHHGAYKSTNADDLLELMNQNLRDYRANLSKAKVLFLTLGTAIGYREKSSDRIVANCHKLPANEFDKRLSTAAEIIAYMRPLISEIQKFNKQLQVVFTVSPVRYWREGARANQISKSHLHLAVDDLCGNFEHCHYFPAFEIVLDELRDYRFFAEDMLHISETAANYVFGRLLDSYLNNSNLSLAKRIEKLSRIAQHKAQDEQKHHLQCDEAQTKIKELLKDAGFAGRAESFRIL
jgi:hypothetical protein